MPEFISKLQYKTCEEGEYFDEKPRNLEETIELIKNFPWAREQYADLGLTGPSVTILDKKGNYLKAGIYYGGRFTLYYFDKHRDFYEYRNTNVEKVYEAVTDFFNGYIKLEKFEKSAFAPGKKKYFVTNKFEYHIRLWKVLLLTAMWSFFFIGCLISALVLLYHSLVEAALMPLVFTTAFSCIEVPILAKYYQKRNQYLKISRGNDLFWFGNTADEVREYNKADIDKITIYEDRNYHSPNDIEVIEIIFNDSSTIVFTNVLISTTLFTEKFSEKWKEKFSSEKVHWFAFLRMIP